ncbi:50S ribosomal protein L24 [uncultured Gimesia sp.]|jgi:large subunit ribosomal protein L24|uniref:50S ribosomal protein L24 n=1 Tax=uncultured Gimesia sp. TaxID=1678688 RepID=UPI002605DFFF|nr:50S ribosomal protein L24 [uncultured Gimesia sp.]
MKIRRGDSVIVITGADAGDTPRRVLKVVDGGKKVTVESVNRVFKHVKRGHPKSPQGGRLEVEMPIDASNVQFYCEACNSKTRIGYRYTDDGSKERFCRSCSASVGTISPPKAKYQKQ